MRLQFHKYLKWKLLLTLEHSNMSNASLKNIPWRLNAIFCYKEQHNTSTWDLDISFSSDCLAHTTCLECFTATSENVWIEFSFLLEMFVIFTIPCCRFLFTQRRIFIWIFNFNEIQTMLSYSDYSCLLLPWEIFSTEALFSLQRRCQRSKKILNSNAVYNFSFIIVIFIIYTRLHIYYNP